MLLFIRVERAWPRLSTKISKHLMLLFICDGLLGVWFIRWFQNISCYCLSTELKWAIHRLGVFQNISCYCLSTFQRFRRCKLCNFKTSHVIVYQGVTTVVSALDKFQNISCYCLSAILSPSPVLKCDFKTSHVIVYRVKVTYPTQRKYFKTSHVIVYRYRSSEVGSCDIISKHLMLLFIGCG